MRTLTLTVTLACLLTTAVIARAQGLPDTPENRRVQTARYLAVQPPKLTIDETAKAAAMSLPPAQRDGYVRALTAAMDANALTRAMSDSMIKHFTADEIKALADFYGSPVGKSATAKLGAYMTDFMPILQAEMLKAQAKIIEARPTR